MSTRRIATLFIAIVTVFGISLGVAGCGLGVHTSSGGNDRNDSDPVNIGVIYPKTGQYAEYGQMFQRGFDLAVAHVNANGGVKGRKLGLKYFDTQSDPKQDAAVAPKLVADKSIIAVVGDYASSASSAASPTFQTTGLVHYSFTNSALTFTDTGDHIWTPAVGIDTLQKANAGIVAKKAKKISVLYIENDWGKQAFEFFKAQAAKNGMQIVYSSSYLADSTDLSPVLIPARDANPDAVVDLGYGPDGALVLNTLRNKLGYTGPFFGGQETPEFFQIAGKNAEDTIITGNFSATGTKDKKAQQFVKDFRTKYGENPGSFEVRAYQAIIDLAYAANTTEPTRAGVQKALQTVTDFPLYEGNGGTFKFNRKTRRAANIKPILEIARNGKFEQYNG